MTVMYKYGGVYSDLDTITLKSFEPLLDEGKSGFGDMFEGFMSINIAVLIFKPKTPFLKYVLEKLPLIYKPYEWGTNGPRLFFDATKEFCEVENVHYHFMPGYFQQMSENNKQTPVYLNSSHKCADLRVFPQQYFYPFLYHNGEFEKIFEKDSKNTYYLKKATSESYSIHYYGKLSSNFKPKPGDNSFFSSIAEEHCSFTYNYVKENNLTFFGVH
jgi:hypothetical protein